MDDAQFANINTKLHRRGTEQRRQFALAKIIFTLLTILRVNLPGVRLPLDSSQLPGRLSIELREELVSQSLYLLEFVRRATAVADRVWLRWFPVAELPLKSTGKELYGWRLRMGFGRSQETAIQNPA